VYGIEPVNKYVITGEECGMNTLIEWRVTDQGEK
jgi:hypothetical protein